VARVTIEIGGIPIALRTDDAEFARMVETRYAGFVRADGQPECEFEVELVPPPRIAPDEDLTVHRQNGLWKIQRGDFQAECNLSTRKGNIRQSANPYSIDSVLRIVHTLILAKQGGFLLHAASAIKNGRAFLFSGLSWAGKTTISRLAPPDVTLLTDEVSYIRREGDGYRAFGTPFAGELAKVGENVSAPVGAVYLLEKGPRNAIELVDAAEAARRLLRNVLFFAEDAELVRSVFESVNDFIVSVPVLRLTFVPDERVWEMIG
jgi:hypothetical protein